jgi:hypothetical protein
MTIAAPESTRKPTGLVRGQAAKIARIHRCTVRHVIGVARGEWGGRESLLKTIEEYRARNVAAQQPAPVTASA